MRDTIKELEELTNQLTARDARLVESEKLFRTAFCINPLPMSLTKLDGTIIKINRVMCEIIGMREEDLVGKKPSDYNLYYDHKERDLIVEKLERGETITEMPVTFSVRSGIILALLSAKIVNIDSIPYILAVCQYTK